MKSEWVSDLRMKLKTKKKAEMKNSVLRLWTYFYISVTFRSWPLRKCRQRSEEASRKPFKRQRRGDFNHFDSSGDEHLSNVCVCASWRNFLSRIMPWNCLCSSKKSKKSKVKELRCVWRDLLKSPSLATSSNSRLF